MIKKIVQICTRWLSYYLFLGIYSILSILRTQWARKFQATAIKLKLKYPNTLRIPTQCQWITYRGLAFPAVPVSHPSNMLLMWGIHEPHNTKVLESVLQPGDFFLDVGAHIGYFSAIASRLVGPSGRVLAIEPLPFILAYLIDVILKNHLENVTILSCALADNHTLTSLSMPVGATSCTSLRDSLEKTVSVRKAPVLTARLDRIVPLEFWKKLKLVKIDVEGAEHLVLKGATDLLQHWQPPYLICEVTDQWLKEMGSSAQELITFLETFGYTPFRPGPEDRWHPWQPSFLPWQFDMLCVHSAALESSAQLGLCASVSKGSFAGLPQLSKGA